MKFSGTAGGALSAQGRVASERCALRADKCGRDVGIENMKTASRTWKEGGMRMGCRGAGGTSAGGLKMGKQAKRPMFSVISQNSWAVRLPSRALMGLKKNCIFVHMMLAKGTPP